MKINKFTLIFENSDYIELDFIPYECSIFLQNVNENLYCVNGNELYKNKVAHNAKIILPNKYLSLKTKFRMSLLDQLLYRDITGIRLDFDGGSKYYNVFWSNGPNFEKNEFQENIFEDKFTTIIIKKRKK